MMLGDATSLQAAIRVGASSLPLILVKTLMFHKEPSRVGNACLLGDAGKEISHDLATGRYVHREMQLRCLVSSDASGIAAPADYDRCNGLLA